MEVAMWLCHILQDNYFLIPKLSIAILGFPDNMAVTWKDIFIDSLDVVCGFEPT